MFGVGWWKDDEEAATNLLEKAGLEKVNGVWNYEGKPFTFEMSYLADTEFQAARGVQAAYNQLTKFGFQCSFASKSSATWDVDGGKGNYQIAGYWPSGGILKDFYYMRWKTWFDYQNELLDGKKPTAIDFYALEEPWTKLTDSYSSEPEGDCISTVKRIFAEVFEQ